MPRAGERADSSPGTFAFMSLGLLVRVTRLSLLAILVAAEPDHQDDMSLPWLRHSLESLTDRRATG
jgi:hypothetical protein